MAYDHLVADSYDEKRSLEPVWHNENRAIERVLLSSPETRSVLDVPFGTGRFVPVYERLGLKVAGLDVSEQMLASARTRYGARLADMQVRCGTAGALPWESRSFDAVVCFRLLHLLPDNECERVVTELARVSKSLVILQVFSLDDRRAGLALRLMREARNRSRFHRSTAWSHIRNYPHDRPTLMRFARAAALTLSSQIDASDSNNRSTVLVFRKAT